jgi:Carboxypeptidase regulatory-like domain
MGFQFARTALGLLVLLRIGQVPFAQEDAKNAIVAIRVTDISGAAVEDAKVRFVEQGTANREVKRTDKTGRALAELKPGKYEVKVTASRFKSVVIRYIEASAAEHRKFEVSLEALPPVAYIGDPVEPPIEQEHIEPRDTEIHEPFALGNTRTQDIQGKQIEVRLIPKKKSIKAGEVLEVRVEIWNVSSKTFFIKKAIYDLCAVSPLSLRLELGPLPKPQVGHGCASDCVFTAKEGFATRLLYHWTTLSPGNFYGTVIALDPDNFPQLNTPGRWRLRGTYKSIGDLSSSLCFDTAPIPNIIEQIKGLPYEAWQGAVDTNAVWVEVVRPGNSPAVRK